MFVDLVFLFSVSLLCAISTEHSKCHKNKLQYKNMLTSVLSMIQIQGLLYIKKLKPKQFVPINDNSCAESIIFSWYFPPQILKDK